MNRVSKRSQVEVLAPAGSYESLTAAVAAGADAVYIGGNRFGARAFADNLDEHRMLEAIDFAHLHGCRLYMTVNTLLRDEELGELYQYLEPYYRRGLDAVIVQDMGVFSYIREHFPDLPIHASTQMTITGMYGAKILKELGASRVVTARELSLREIEQIHQNVDVEIESFVHGALCYSYSGQCLLSSLIGGRSGNRGRCAQPCRLPYDVMTDKGCANGGNQKYVLSLKDLCTLDLIPDMIEAGVYSLKIEGRMKSPRYTAGVVSMYRKYVDLYLEKGRDGFKVQPKDKEMLLELFDRGGFTDGYYRQHNGRDMVAVKEKPSFREGNQELFRQIEEAYLSNQKQKTIQGIVYLEEGKSVKLTLTAFDSITCKEMRSVVEGDLVQTAQNQPMTAEKLKKQIGKTGGTSFVFDQLTAEIKGNGFLPIGALNELRRRALEQLEAEILKQYTRECEKRTEKNQTENIENTAARTEPIAAGAWHIHVTVADRATFDKMTEIPEVKEISLDCACIEPSDWKYMAERCHKLGKQCDLLLPHIFRTEAVKYFTEQKARLFEADFDAFIVRSLEETGFLKEQGFKLPLYFDDTMYAFNGISKKMMQILGAVRQTLPLELNSRELAKRGCEGEEIMVYGYIPVMVSAQCIKKTVSGCSGTPQIIKLKDRTGKEMPVKNVCRFCYNEIYNSSPLSLAGQGKIIKNMGVSSVRLHFTIETPAEAERITKAYIREFCYGEQVDSPVNEFTRGHFKRGVE